jgi:two-component system nitrate/nitrite response regulator NarL
MAEAAQQPLPQGEALTEREDQILDRLADGRCNKQIARELDIAEATVKVHIKHLLRKLGVRSRLEAAVWALNHPQQRRRSSDATTADPA